jgi:hypothetical protein
MHRTSPKAPIRDPGMAPAEASNCCALQCTPMKLELPIRKCQFLLIKHVYLNISACSLLGTIEIAVMEWLSNRPVAIPQYGLIELTLFCDSARHYPAANYGTIYDTIHSLFVD